MKAANRKYHNRIKTVPRHTEGVKRQMDGPNFSHTNFSLRGATIVYDVQKQELVVNGHRAAAMLSNGRQGLTIFCDRNGLEVFASGGLCYVPMPFIPKADDLSVGITVPEGEIRNFSAVAHELRSAWTSR